FSGTAQGGRSKKCEYDAERVQPSPRELNELQFRQEAPENLTRSEHQETRDGRDREKHPPQCGELASAPRHENRKNARNQHHSERESGNLPIEEDELRVAPVSEDEIVLGTQILRHHLRDLHPALLERRGQNVEGGEAETQGDCRGSNE